MSEERNIEKLRRWCIRKHGQGWSVVSISSHAQVPLRTVYSWLEKQRRYGSVKDRSRAPNTIHGTPKEIVDRIVELRRSTSRSEYAIASYLEREGVSVSHSTVYRVLSKNGLINPLPKPRQKRTYKRFARRHPNSLWQADLTIFRRKYIIAFMDDRSRFLTAIEWLSAPKADLVTDVFDEAIRQYGRPRHVITDHGTQFYSVRGGTSSFDQYCHEQKIRHIMGGIAKPTTQGKIERFFHTLKTEYGQHNDLGAYADYYNNKRLHAGIGYLTPAEVYYER